MLLVILLVILAGAIGRSAWGNWHYEDRFTLIGGSLAIFLMGAIVSALFVVMVGVATGTEAVPAGSSSLAALKSDDQTSGSFFLGTGRVDEELTFNYIEEHSGGYYTRESVEADRAKVFTDTNEPRVDKFTRTVTNGWVTPWDLPINSTYEFHVPEGSIVESYVVTP